MYHAHHMICMHIHIHEYLGESGGNMLSRPVLIGVESTENNGTCSQNGSKKVEPGGSKTYIK